VKVTAARPRPWPVSRAASAMRPDDGARGPTPIATNVRPGLWSRASTAIVTWCVASWRTESVSATNPCAR
jgi:hypothetical protein